MTTSAPALGVDSSVTYARFRMESIAMAFGEKPASGTLATTPRLARSNTSTRDGNTGLATSSRDESGVTAIAPGWNDACSVNIRTNVDVSMAEIVLRCG